MNIETKTLTIRGLMTSYKVTVFSVPKIEPIIRAGFGEDAQYIAMIIWGPKSYLVIDRRGGYAAWSLEKAGIYCMVLEKAWQFILNYYDAIRDGDHLEIIHEGDDSYKVVLSSGWKY